MFTEIMTAFKSAFTITMVHPKGGAGRQLLVSSFPRVELQVPDLLTCAIERKHGE